MKWEECKSKLWWRTLRSVAAFCRTDYENTRKVLRLDVKRRSQGLWTTTPPLNNYFAL
jgi:hypothetical protein